MWPSQAHEFTIIHPQNAVILAAYNINMTRVLWLPLAVLALGVASAQTIPDASFEGDWRLVRITDGGQLRAVNPTHAPTLRAGAGRVSGSTGCNSYGGSLDVTGTSLKFGTLISTKKACMDYIDGLESRFLELMESARRFEQSDNQLTVTGADGLLVFQKVSSLPPTPAQAVLGRWQLTALTEQNVARPVGGQAPLTLEVRRGQVSGSDGCNAFSGPLSSDGRRFKVGALAQTKRACLETALNTQAGAYTGLLARMATFKVAGDTLTLYGPEGAALSFSRTTP